MNQYVIEKALSKLHISGVISAEDVVRAARPVESPLHNLFEWDDTKAGHNFRLWQARCLLVRYKVEYKNNNIPIRVSLVQDRKTKGGGYRYTEDVLSDEELRAQLIKTAMDDFNRLKTRYTMLTMITDHIEMIINILHNE